MRLGTNKKHFIFIDIDFFSFSVNKLRQDAQGTAGVSRSTSGIGSWPLTRMTTVQAFSWTGFCSHRAAFVDVNHKNRQKIGTINVQFNLFV